MINKTESKSIILLLAACSDYHKEPKVTIIPAGFFFAGTDD